MIKTLKIQNFRGFIDHTVEFANFTLLTGRNNAGKTTIIEALRVISVAQSRIKSAKFESAPEEFAGSVTGPVFRFSLNTIDFDEQNIHHNYRIEDPAIIQMTLTNNCRVTVYLGSEPGDRFCQIQHAGGKKIANRKDGLKPKFHRVFVMPPVGSLLTNETERAKRYLRVNINGYLSYRHIRNQMAEMPDEFERFRNELERTWDGLQVQSLNLQQTPNGSRYELMIRDGRYPAEVARLGSGLQAWIQTLWFLSRVDAGSIIVLDEPDVYLHADLQKNLVRLLGNTDYRQKIVATHSIEMISDVSPEEIIEVQKSETRSKPISTKAEVQAVLNGLGTSHHIQLSKLGKTGQVLFVEGKDHKFLGLLASKMGKQHARCFEEIPRFEIGGMGNWKRAAMTAKVLNETSSGELLCKLLIDSDYFTEDYLNDIVAQGARKNLEVIFWRKKEIENYFLNTHAIWEYIQKNSQKKVDRFDIDKKVEEFSLALFEKLPEQVAQNIQMNDRRLSIPTALQKAKDLIGTKISAGLQPIDMVSGKELFSALSSYSQQTYGVSISATAICREIQIEQVPEQILKVVSELTAKGCRPD